MEFRIADTFTQSLTRLTGEEQKAVKTSAFDLQLNRASPGLQLHKLDRAKDKNFWSVRVNRDIRIIVHRTERSFLLCYVAHHDDAYAWAERRRLEAHPRTGAAQLVEIQETVREIEVPRYVEPAAVLQEVQPPALLFSHVSDDELLDYGVPVDWLERVKVATEDTLFSIAEHLPQEASEALLELATGGTPVQPEIAAAGSDPFTHPDAQRRFRVMADADELERALSFPWDRWTVFLHPSQQQVVDRSFNGPARVSGSAGTGKTVVALHRAVALARKYDEERVLVTTFSIPLARDLNRKVQKLIGDRPSIRERIEVRSINEVGIEVLEKSGITARIATDTMVRSLLKQSVNSANRTKFTQRFFETEWRDVVDAWQLQSWEQYRDVSRLGRKSRLSEQQRKDVWPVFEAMRSRLKDEGLYTSSMAFASATQAIQENASLIPAERIVVDEAQDISVAQLQFLAMVAGDRADGLFFAGDEGQRIFQFPFSWKSLGVDVRGRSQILKINYRTSHQIRVRADMLLPVEIADVDHNTESRRGIISAFNGNDPLLRLASSEKAERDLVAEWLRTRIAEGYTPEQLAVFVRDENQLDRAVNAVAAAGMNGEQLSMNREHPAGYVAVGTMHLAKGMEFRAVAVIACDEDVMPLQTRLATAADEAELEEIHDTERHLLYVACTRARDELLVSGVEPGSEFLEDMLVAK